MAAIIFLVLLAVTLTAACFVYSGVVFGIPGNGRRMLAFCGLAILTVWQFAQLI